MRVATIDAMGCASVHTLPSAIDADADADASGEVGPAKKRARRDGDSGNIADASSSEACQGVVLQTGGSHGAGGYGATARGWGDIAFRYVRHKKGGGAHRVHPFTCGAVCKGVCEKIV